MKLVLCGYIGNNSKYWGFLPSFLAFQEAQIMSFIRPILLIIALLIGAVTSKMVSHPTEHAQSN